MKISVIIPTYNRVALLERALESVVSQQLPGCVESMQIIVVDDGSIDETEQMVSSKFPRVSYLKQANKGVSAARNLGFKTATGDWLALLDSDDEWLENKLSRQISLLNDSELLVCHTEEVWIRNGRRVNQMNKHQKSGGWIFEQCLPLCVMSPSSIMLHESVLSKVGNFDESLPACEDYDLWLRITSQYEVAFVTEPSINKYGGHEDQLSRQHWGMDRFRVIALDKILHEVLSPSNQAAAVSMLFAKLKILMLGATKHGNQELLNECDNMKDRWQYLLQD